MLLLYFSFLEVMKLLHLTFSKIRCFPENFKNVYHKIFNDTNFEDLEIRKKDNIYINE